jgi:hypothetical protein
MSLCVEAVNEQIYIQTDPLLFDLFRSDMGVAASAVVLDRGNVSLWAAGAGHRLYAEFSDQRHSAGIFDDMGVCQK